MNVSPLAQILGNVCIVLAALVVLLPLRRLLRDYADTYINDNRWVKPALFILIPLWLLLLGALLCVTASGGFDWLRLVRPALYPLTVAASLALVCVSFVFVGCYIRPGFLPRGIYVPGIYLAPLATGLLVVLSLNQKLAPGFPIQWLRWPWTIFATLSLFGCVRFFGPRLVKAGFGGMANFADRILTARRDSPDPQTIGGLDPQHDFAELLKRARAVESRAVREAAIARLRTNPAFVETLATILASRQSETALEYLHDATLSPDEAQRLALPARTAIEGFIAEITDPNFMPPERRKQLLKWGRKAFPAIAKSFSGTDVDFSQVMPKLEHALRRDDARR